MKIDANYTEQLESLILKLHKGWLLSKEESDLIKDISYKARKAKQKIAVLLRKN